MCISDLPFPRTKTLLDVFDDYARTIREDFPAEAKMADQLLKDGALHQWIVLTPVLATTDIVHIENYVLQYALQEKLAFTVVLFPNASLSLDPNQEAVDLCCKEIERLQSIYPQLDLRYVRDPQPAENFTSIGSLRRKLWDSAVLASYEKGNETTGKGVEHFLAHSKGKESFTPSEIVPLAAFIKDEPIFFNHDVDLVHLPKDYMFEMAWQVCQNYFFAEEKASFDAFSSRAKHGRVENFPNANAVVSLYDYLISSVKAGFEACLVIPGCTYTKFGGFNTLDYTYEVAGFVRGGKTFHVPYIELTTDQRRFNSKLHHTSVTLLWGLPQKGTSSNFSDKDECRVDSPEDITADRKDDLIIEFDKDTTVSGYLFQAAVNDVYDEVNDETYENFLKLFQEEEPEEDLTAIYEEWEKKLRVAARKRTSDVWRVLYDGKFEKKQELMKKIRQEIKEGMADECGKVFAKISQKSASTNSTT